MGWRPRGMTYRAFTFATPVQPDILASDPIYPHFVDPTGPGARGESPRGRTARAAAGYLGCTDDLPGSRSSGATPKRSGAGGYRVVALAGRHLKPQAYVRQVAPSLTMTVLVTSGLWHTPGAVSPQWRMNSPAPVCPALRR